MPFGHSAFSDEAKVVVSFVNKSLTVGSYVDGPMGHDGNEPGSKLSSGRGPCIPSYTSEEDKAIMFLSEVGNLVFIGRDGSPVTGGLVLSEGTIGPPYTSPPNTKVLLEGVDPTAISEGIDGVGSSTFTSIRDGHDRLVFSVFKVRKHLPSIKVAIVN